MLRLVVTTLALSTLLNVIAITQADARHHRHKHWTANTERIVEHPMGCPSSAFCGCGVSVKVFGKPMRDLFLARNWFRFPRTGPAPGMVAVRRHHVMQIISLDGNGNATVYDPNSGGHRTRVHTRSLSGYTIVNPHSVKL